MPNYKFKCLDCGHKFQKLLPAGHEAQKCLECGHPETQKLLEAPGVQFKTGGFYVTDSKKTEASPSSEVKSESKAEAKNEPKIESKPESKPPAPDAKKE